jgi:hypothetical protein
MWTPTLISQPGASLIDNFPKKLWPVAWTSREARRGAGFVATGSAEMIALTALLLLSQEREGDPCHITVSLTLI